MQFMLTSKGDLATVFFSTVDHAHAPAGEYHSPVGYK
jgi:hypothetical protein